MFILSCCLIALFKHSCKGEIFVFVKLKHVPKANIYALDKKHTNFRKSYLKSLYAFSAVFNDDDFQVYTVVTVVVLIETVVREDFAGGG